MRAQADSIVQALTETDSNDAAIESNEVDDVIVQPEPKTETINNHKRSIVLYQDDWHQGVIGIVAGRLKESHYLPSIVFAPADTQRTGEDDAIKAQHVLSLVYIFVMRLSRSLSVILILSVTSVDMQWPQD